MVHIHFGNNCKSHPPLVRACWEVVPPYPVIRFRTDQPDYSFLPDQDFDWTYSVYGNVQEILPDDMPEPLGKVVITPQPWMLI